MEDGNCRRYPPGVFFPSDGAGVDHARRICATCPVKDECLEHALVNRIDHGVWGGASERERRRILERRRSAPSAGRETEQRSQRAPRGVAAARRGFTPCRWACRRRPGSSGLP
ncbi:MAG TPA: WhiB family transcriptional regulator [Acidimicrobiales bacterium]|nr:WhiB family transcriptional regulator [Acidimicrobiales bacterium]